MEQIAAKYLRELTRRGKNAGVELQLPEGLAAAISRNGVGKAGARQLRRQLQEQVEMPLTAFLLQQEQRPASVRGELIDGKLNFFA